MILAGRTVTCDSADLVHNCVVALVGTLQFLWQLMKLAGILVQDREKVWCHNMPVITSYQILRISPQKFVWTFCFCHCFPPWLRRPAIPATQLALISWAEAECLRGFSTQHQYLFRKWTKKLYSTSCGVDLNSSDNSKWQKFARYEQMATLWSCIPNEYVCC